MKRFNIMIVIIVILTLYFLTRNHGKSVPATNHDNMSGMSGMNEDSETEMMDDQDGMEMDHTNMDGLSVTATMDHTQMPDMEHAWDFTLSDIDGNSVTLSDLQGRWVLLNFWATWCKPCVKEMPVLQSISQEYSETLSVIGINVREEASLIRLFLQEKEITYTILLTPNEENANRVLTDFQSLSLPQSVIIAPNGEIVWRQFGELELESFEETLTQVIYNWENQ